MASIKCKHCGVVLTSRSRHDFQSHVCIKAGKVSLEFDFDLGEYVPAYPTIFVDGGNDYTRIGGDRSDWELIDTPTV